MQTIGICTTTAPKIFVSSLLWDAAHPPPGKNCDLIRWAELDSD